MSDVGLVQFTLSDGYAVARFPLFRVNGEWHLVFLGWPLEPRSREEVMARRGLSLSERVQVEAVDGEVVRLSSGGHGASDREQYHLAFTASSATTAVQVLYRTPGADDTREKLHLMEP